MLIVIGIALLGFILTDLLSSGNSIFRGDVNTVGRVNGRTVESPEFSTMMAEQQALIEQQNPEQARNISQKQLADRVWLEYVREEIMSEQYDKLGFKVTTDELYQRLKQNPNIQSAPAFQGSNGQFNEAAFQQYLVNLRDNRGADQQAADVYEQWVNFEKGTRQQTLQNKYNIAIQKGLYVPKGMAQALHQRSNASTQAKMVVKEFNDGDTSVQVSDGELRDYYKKNKKKYEAEESADIQYVNFTIQPSEKDKDSFRAELGRFMKTQYLEGRKGRMDTVMSFAESEDDSLYASARSDEPVRPDYYKKGQLPPGLDSALFEREVGYVHGPYEDGNFFRLTKILDKRELPDSAKARHILISFQGLQNGNAERTPQQAKELADSLLKIVKNDTARFAALARQVSDDPGSGAKGGDLGWFNDRSMVRPFGNFVFRNEVGNIGLVYSQFGFHIIEILDQAGGVPALKLLNIAREVTPSEETLDLIYAEASQFAASVSGVDDFAAKAEAKGYSPRPATNLKKFDEQIPGLGASRPIVKWANGIGADNEDVERGDIQLFNNGNDSYVVTVLTGQNKDGHRSFESVKEEIRPLVIKDKKAEKFMEDFREAMQGKSDIEAVASAMGLTVVEQAFSFKNNTIAGIGSEPRVVGAIANAKPNQLTGPLKGENGVFVISVLSRNPAPELPNPGDEANTLVQTTRGRVPSQVYNSLKEKAKIDDRRARFY